MWVKNNPNPMQKQVGDCTIRAITKATDQSWEDVFCGLAVQGFLMCDMPSANSVTTAYLRKNRYRRRTLPDTCPDCYTVKDFCKDHPKGRYVLGTGTHVIAVEDGCYFDSWDSGNETPTYYFEREDD